MTEKLQINRIALKQSAIVEIIHVESPSSIFVRPVNHLRDSLIYREPYKLNVFANYTEGDYAIAPIEERTLGRCKILKKLNHIQSAKVFFIDDGLICNVKDTCICKLEPDQVFYPWQVMHVTLAKVQTLEENGWNAEKCDGFRRILDEFESFEIIAAEYDLDVSSTRESLMVEMYGIQSNEKRKVSITSMLTAMFEDVEVSPFPRTIENPSIDYTGDDADFYIDEIRQEIPENWQHERSKYRDEEDEFWSIENARISLLNTNNVEEYKDKETGKLFAYVEGNTVSSPGNSFIRLVRPMLEEDTLDTWLTKEMDELEEFFEDMNAFYREIINQKPLGYEEMQKGLENGPLFGVCCMSHRKNGNDCKWLRVQILKLTIEAIEVRFLDVCGVATVKQRQLHRINAIHTKHIPFIIQLEVRNIKFDDFNFQFDDPKTFGISTKSMKVQKTSWPPELYRLWIDLIPYDIPIVIENYEITEDGIITCGDFRSIDEDVGLIRQFIEKSGGKAIVRAEDYESDSSYCSTDDGDGERSSESSFTE